MSAGEKFSELVSIMARLRAPGGCPWDREQTFASIKPYVLEESYEVMDAIDQQNWPALAEELGDLLLQPVFLAEMAAEAGHFNIEDSLQAITAKLIRRHPHIFATGDAKTPEDVKRKWDEIKAQEKAERGESIKALLDGVPRTLPALVAAQQLTAKASTVGFDWENPAQVDAKISEELDELAEARRAGNSTEVEEELGDLLFAIVNLARHLKVDPEQALRKTNEKFRHRFGYVEQHLATQGRALASASLDEMEELWQEAKRT